MKKIILIVAAFAGSFGAHAQVEINPEGAVIDISGTMVDGSGDATSMSYYMTFQNTSNVARQYICHRKKIQVVPGVEDEVCWGADIASGQGQCYPRHMVTPDDPFITPDAYTIDAGRTGIIYSYHFPNGNSGESIYRYILFADGVVVDSVDVRYNYTLSVPQEKPTSFSIYPNPANNIVNVKVANSNGQNSITIYDIAGKIVAESFINNGTNPIDVSALNAGVYFYTLRNTEGIIETKKLLIQ